MRFGTRFIRESKPSPLLLSPESFTGTLHALTWVTESHGVTGRTSVSLFITSSSRQGLYCRSGHEKGYLVRPLLEDRAGDKSGQRPFVTSVTIRFSRDSGLVNSSLFHVGFRHTSWRLNLLVYDSRPTVVLLLVTSKGNSSNCIEETLQSYLRQCNDLNLRRLHIIIYGPYDIPSEVLKERNANKEEQVKDSSVFSFQYDVFPITRGYI